MRFRSNTITPEEFAAQVRALTDAELLALSRLLVERWRDAQQDNDFGH